MKKIILFLSLAVIYCCTPKVAPPAATTTPASSYSAADIDRCKTYWADCSAEKLDAAHSLYTGKCASCHALIKPKDKSEETWRKMVPPMAKKAHLTADEEAQILAYVLTMRGQQ